MDGHGQGQAPFTPPDSGLAVGVAARVCTVLYAWQSLSARVTYLTYLPCVAKHDCIVTVSWRLSPFLPNDSCEWLLPPHRSDSSLLRDSRVALWSVCLSSPWLAVGLHALSWVHVSLCLSPPHLSKPSSRGAFSLLSPSTHTLVLVWIGPSLGTHL